MRKLLAFLLVVSMLFSFCAFSAAEEETAKPVVIIYTNDVHCGVDSNIGYAGLAAYKKAYEANGYETFLVDCGDSIQGEAIGTISSGEYIIDLMNHVGYSLATIGNHEFDYGIDRFNELKEKAQFDYICCNFTDLEGNPILTPYVIKDLGGYKVGFVGVDTPHTFVSSIPTNFQDENGNFVCDFCGGNGGQDLYDVVQKNVDAVRAEGAQIVILLAHLGTEYLGEDKAWMSTDVIANTTGIDVVLDAHSHSTIEGDVVLNKDGEEVIMSSTGTKLASIGTLTFTEEEGEFTFATQLHDEALFQDADEAAYVGEIKAQFDETLQTVVAHTDVDLVIYDPTAVNEEGKPIRIVRSQETNLGDLCADAYRYVGGTDVAFVNGGGVRDQIPMGDITYEQIIKVHPFGNTLTVVEAKGQQILDLLEMGVANLPGESGGFQHVSGLTFEINMAVESSVVTDENGTFVEVSGDRRVQNVLINGEPIDPEATYTVASHNYLLKAGGDGLTMFVGDTVLQDEVMLDNQVLMTYITEGLNGVVGEEYADPYGEGRIVILDAE